MSIRMSSGSLRGLIKEARKAEGFEERLKRNMDAVVEVTFSDMQSHVHVFTGALKGSGEWSSEIDESGDYSAVIEFGRGLPYAIYELNRRDHGVDQVFRSHEEAMEAAIIAALHD